ncbi:MAG: hypothetical protein D6718_04590, partial [Acidobacteria bacterium]
TSPPNLIVLTTPPGEASAAALALDQLALPGIAGTLAGDDTVFVAIARGANLAQVARRIRATAELRQRPASRRRRTPPAGRAWRRRCRKRPRAGGRSPGTVGRGAGPGAGGAAGAVGVEERRVTGSSHEKRRWRDHSGWPRHRHRRFIRKVRS